MANRLNVTTIRPTWPGRQYQLACPAGTSARDCDQLSSSSGALAHGCTEPEPDTVEVLNSFLLGGGENVAPPLYVDIGCNIGYHAAHAAALGARVECYEPTPMYVAAMQHSRELSVNAERWTVKNVAVTPDRKSGARTLRLHSAYAPCGIGIAAQRSAVRWEAPTMPMRDIVRGKNISLLKIDIDSVEGKLLHTVERSIARGESFIDTILIEIGDNDSPDAWCTAAGGGADRLQQTNESATPTARCLPLPRADNLRGGSVRDFWQLQWQHGYDAYRVNVHTGREIYNWRGVNVNMRMAEVPSGLRDMYFVRNMRKLEWLDPRTPLADYPALFRWGQSYLLTRVRLATVAKHHWYDLTNMEYGARAVQHRRMVRHQNVSDHARLQRTLNVGNPVEQPRRRPEDAPRLQR